MEVTSIGDGAEMPNKATIKRSLSDALETTDLSLNYYELEHGDEFSNALHTHLDQEELFYIISGTATFETEKGQIELSEGEAIRFGRGEYQHGYNDEDERVVALALGAPKGSTEFRFECPYCGTRMQPHKNVEENTGRVVYHCRECEKKISEMS